jgi:hypothetical protein
MSNNWIWVENYRINPDHIAFVEQREDKAIVHLALAPSKGELGGPRREGFSLG